MTNDEKGCSTMRKTTDEDNDIAVALVAPKQVDGEEAGMQLHQSRESSFCVVIVPELGLSSNHAPTNVSISPWLWGGIYVRARAAGERFNSSMRTLKWAIYLVIAVVMGCWSAVQHLLPFLPISGWMNTIIIYAVVFAVLKVLTMRFRPVYARAMHTDLERVLQDLSPFIRGEGKHDLSLEVVAGPPDCYEERNHFKLCLTPLTSQEQRDQEQQDSAPLLWPSEDGYIQKGEVKTSVLHRWYMLSSVQKWTPTVLQGHEEVDVFTWGLVYTKLDSILAKEFQFYVMLAFMVGLFYMFFLSCAMTYVLDPDDTWPDSVNVVLALSIVVVPWLLYEFLVAKASPKFHRRCEEAVQGLAPQVQDKCSYDLAYTVSEGWLYGSTSTLRIFPVEASAYSTIV